MFLCIVPIFWTLYDGVNFGQLFKFINRQMINLFVNIGSIKINVRYVEGLNRENAFTVWWRVKKRKEKKQIKVTSGGISFSRFETNKNREEGTKLKQLLLLFYHIEDKSKTQFVPLDLSLCPHSVHASMCYNCHSSQKQKKENCWNKTEAKIPNHESFGSFCILGADASDTFLVVMTLKKHRDLRNKDY